MVAPLDIPNRVEQEKYGEKLEQNSVALEKSRSRTDYCWFLFFIFYLVTWSMIIIYAFSYGNTEKWSRPSDSAGRVCGKDEEVRDSPYLVEYNENSCSALGACLVCRKACPSADFAYDASLLDYENGNKMRDLKQLLERMICKPEVLLADVSSQEQLDYLVDRQLCAGQYRASNATDWRCNVWEGSEDAATSAWRHALSRFERDFHQTHWSIFGFLTFSAFCALLSILLMRWNALAFVCGSIFIFYVVVFNFVYEKCVVDSENKTFGALMSLVIFVGLLISILSFAAYFWRQIYLACQMIQESSKAITCMLSSLILPLTLLTLYLFALHAAARAGFYLTSIESAVYRVDFAEEVEACYCPDNLAYSQNSTCDPGVFRSKCRSKKLKECLLSSCRLIGKRGKNFAGSLHFLNFLGIYWSYWYVLGFMDTLLASIFATWYWTYNKKLLSYLTVIESFWRIVTYHLGSVAFGSLIMFFCQVIRFIVNTTHSILQLINKPMAELVFINFQWIVDSMEKFFNFVNQRAYITCAVHGSDFLQSGRTSFYLLMRNTEKIVTIFEYTNWVIFLLTLLISCITTRMSTSYFAGIEDLTYPNLLSFIVFTGSLLVTWMILRTVDIAVNTIFLCFLEDFERNDNSYQKPYFMHEELPKFLYKK